jgi:tRNA dimethylallyltransferase
MVAKLLVIVGPTASGKSDLAMKLAKKLEGEIICADSRTVYKGLNIGTAKPSATDRVEVPHHILDIIEPDEDFNVADFKRLAEQAMEDIQARGKFPILVGGSGLYVDAVLFDYEFSETNSPKDDANPRHLDKNVPRRRSELRKDTLVIGLAVDKEELKARIEKRIEEMLAQGLIEEVRQIQAHYPGSKALLAPGYKAFSEHLAGRLSLEEAKALFIKNDYNLAKRQISWFKRNKKIHWLNTKNTYIEDTLKLLNKLH